MFPIEFTPELVEAMNVYEKKFGEGFPAEYVAADTESRIARVKECLATNTPVPQSEYAEAMMIV